MHYGLQGLATDVVSVTSKALAKNDSDFQDVMMAETGRTSELTMLRRSLRCTLPFKSIFCCCSGPLAPHVHKSHVHHSKSAQGSGNHHG